MSTSSDKTSAPVTRGALTASAAAKADALAKECAQGKSPVAMASTPPAAYTTGLQRNRELPRDAMAVMIELTDTVLKLDQKVTSNFDTQVCFMDNYHSIPQAFQDINGDFSVVNLQLSDIVNKLGEMDKKIKDLNGTIVKSEKTLALGIENILRRVTALETKVLSVQSGMKTQHESLSTVKTAPTKSTNRFFHDL